MSVDTTIVVEETIYKSQENVRFESARIRKSFPLELGNVTDTSNVLQYGDTVSLPSMNFLHIHSNADIDIAITKGSDTLTITTRLLTLSDTIDSVVITNNSSDDANVYMLYGK